MAALFSGCDDSAAEPFWSSGTAVDHCWPLPFDEAAVLLLLAVAMPPFVVVVVDPADVPLAMAVPFSLGIAMAVFEAGCGGEAVVGIE